MSEPGDTLVLVVHGAALLAWAVVATRRASREQRRRLAVEAELEGVRLASRQVIGELGSTRARLADGWARDSIAAAVHHGAISQEQEPCPRCGSVRVDVQPLADATWRARCLDCNTVTQPDATPAQARVAWRVAQPVPKGGL